MSFTQHQSNVIAIKPGDPNFVITDGLTQFCRAGFEIGNNCPAEYKSIFVTAINAGWLKPVAYMYNYELTFDILKAQ